jgi:hypothetical protein
MANELVLEYETDIPIPFTCADGATIEKGALLTLSDPMTVATDVLMDGIVGGVAAEEKIASDGKTKIAVYRGGIFKVVISGNVTVGDPLTGVGVTNRLETAAINDENVYGIALETGTNGESILFELKPTRQQLA